MESVKRTVNGKERRYQNKTPLTYVLAPAGDGGTSGGGTNTGGTTPSGGGGTNPGGGDNGGDDGTGEND